MNKWQFKIAKLFGKDLKVQARDMNKEGSSAFQGYIFLVN